MPSSFTSARTGFAITVVEAGRASAGYRYVQEVFVPPMTPFKIIRHIHPIGTEQFDLLDGSACYELGREAKPLRVGESFLVPEGSSHVHPYTADGGPIAFRQTIVLPTPSLPILTYVERFFATLVDLDDRGKLGADGSPKNLIHALALIDGFQGAVMLDGMPLPAQRVLLRLGTILWRLAGQSTVVRN